MTAIRRLLAVAVLGAVLGLSAAAVAQTAGEASRGSTPPGTAQDGSRPSEGAITGGTILPGERSGVPEAGTVPDQAPSRCYELSGTLRDQCLLQEKEKGASAGATRRPTPPLPADRDPLGSPPPQNPR